jgi:hypothetical protein
MWNGHESAVKEFFKSTGLMKNVEHCYQPHMDVVSFVGANGLHALTGTKNCLFTLTGMEMVEHNNKRKFKKLLRKGVVGRFEVINY